MNSRSVARLVRTMMDAKLHTWVFIIPATDVDEIDGTPIREGNNVL
jgi:hypothetical protein